MGHRPRHGRPGQQSRATADTLFRIGSTSKVFVSLSILMLVDQGKLSLDDPVHKLAPEVWFDNPWESSDPVRAVNLLEHTTGWDDLHFREYAKQAPDSMSLREASTTIIIRVRRAGLPALALRTAIRARRSQPTSSRNLRGKSSKILCSRISSTPSG
jgi:CubicO group peptidase (beta-lactamase class C family)